MSAALERIHKDLESFIRKYYLDLIIRGSIYALVILTLCLIGFALISFFGADSILVRTILFYLFLASSIFILVKFIFIPLLALFRIGRKVSEEDAAQILGNHFPEVSDKLTNLLDLEKLNSSDQQLLRASIDQKAAGFKSVSFVSAVQLKSNWKKAKLILIPTALILLFVITGKLNVISSGAEGLIAHREVLVKPAPFFFELQNKDLVATQSEAYEVVLKLSGDKIPDKVYLKQGDFQKKMERVGPNTFKYIIVNPTENFKIQFAASGINSSQYEIKVLAKPILNGFTSQLNYPSYLNKANITLENQGDFTVPEGTEITWELNAVNTKFIKFNLADKSISPEQNGEQFIIKETAINSFLYEVTAVSKAGLTGTPLSYQVKVTPDAHPKITIKKELDSTQSSFLYFSIQAEDDYGISKVLFTSSINGELSSKPISIKKNEATQNLYHLVNLDELNIKPGDQLSFYAETWDNDAINGVKYARTTVVDLKVKTKEELASAIKANDQKIKDQLKENIDLAKEVNKEIDELKKALLDKKKLSWEEKQKLESILAKQKKLKQNLDQIKQQNELKKQAQEKLEPQSNELLKKQQELEDLMNKVLDKETLEMMQKMQEMMEEMDKEKLEDAIKDWEKKQESLEEELDRNLELYKRLEVEQNMEDAIEKLEELSQKQEELAEKESQTEEEKEATEKAQEELTEEFKKIEEELEDIEKKNKELETPMPLDTDKESQEEIKKDQEGSQEDMKQGEMQKAQKKQKDAAKKMQELAEQMQASMQSAQSQQAAEDTENLRQILENLVSLSVDQEALSDETNNINVNNPRYVDLIREQNKLNQDANFIADSLKALAKRVSQIAKPITEELEKMQANIELSIDELAERNINNAASHQQFTMTSANNLALLLSEVLQQMQEQMAQQMPGNQSCQKPGQGKPSPGTMKQMQQQLNDQMKAMEKMLKEGKKPGNGKPGGQMSKSMAQMAAKQEAIRQQLQKLAEEQGADGSGAAKELREAMDKMEQTEEELLNREISLETLKRQEEILTRLLEAENAERERKQDNKRESEEAFDIVLDKEQKFLEYQELKKKQAELLKSLPPSLSEFYKSLSNQYLNAIGND